MALVRTEPSAFVARRRALHERLGGPALLAAGTAHSRNFPANRYPFRASSHFLYFVGRHMPDAMLLFDKDRTILFTHAPDPGDALWHGPRPALSELQDKLGLDEVRPLASLGAAVEPLRSSLATLPTHDAASSAALSGLLGREILAGSGGALVDDKDAALADAVIALRLVHDEAALLQLRHVAQVSAEAHVAGMCATRVGGNERQIAAAMLQVMREAGCSDAYGPIVTVKGEVLHAEYQGNPTEAGQLLLADVGAENEEGWAGDITRAWPISGRFSTTQRAIYQVVLAAELAAIEVAQPGVSYREVHEAAKRVVVAGLRDLGIFRGEVDGLLERGGAAIFFPHGVGHLLGLDVHDMEDLGDRAGYAPGRTRSEAFGDAFLRLDRDLVAGMVVTIEPGFYQVPGILADDKYTAAVGADLDRNELAKYADVRGIRIEDDVLITEAGNEILSAGVPKEIDAIEAIMAS